MIVTMTAMYLIFTAASAVLPRSVAQPYLRRVMRDPAVL
jgi:hypothetical protein